MNQKPSYEELVIKIAELEDKIDRNTIDVVNSDLIDKMPQHDVEKLRLSNEMMQLVMDNIPQFIFWKDRNSVYLGCNRNFALAAGVENPEAICGKTDHDLAWKKEEADFFIECDQRVMENDSPEYHIIEPQLQAGGYQAWLDTNKIPLHDSKGKVVGMLGTYENITEKKKTQETLQLYEKIVATTKDLMSIINTEYVYLAVNDALVSAYGKERNEIVGSTVMDLLSRKNFEKWAKPNLQMAFLGNEVAFETWVEYPSHGSRYMRITYYPYFDNEKTCIGVVGNAQDITHIRDLERKLVQSQKMEAIGTLAGGIAHDFNNILGGIMGYTQLAQLHSKGNQKVQKYLHSLSESSSRAAALVKQILTFSRQSESQKVPIDLSVAVNEALHLLRASIPVSIDITTNIKNSTGVIEADQTQIQQIVMNLCTNSFQSFEEDGGKIDVSLAPLVIHKSDLISYQDLKVGRYIRLSVADNGKGIPPEYMNRIFEPYFTTKEIGEGTGLGLATVHGIVRDHGGYIKVYSEQGVGTTFQVLFPIIEDRDDVIVDDAVKLMPGKETILFVDDEISLVEIAKDILKELGYRVDTFTRSIEALKAIKKHVDKYDLVITDMTMPELSGEKLVAEIKKIRDDIPIIMCLTAS
jgi:two-component system cell cycle sensor histidine kinase/response regulator CckA